MLHCRVGSLLSKFTTLLICLDLADYFRTKAIKTDFLYQVNWNNLVNKVTGYHLGNKGLFPSEGRDVSFHCHVQNYSGMYSALFSMGSLSCCWG
jgi:hypothetical protein